MSGKTSRDEAEMVDLLWEAQDLLNLGHSVSSQDLRNTAGGDLTGFASALHALDEIQRALPSVAAPTLMTGDRIGDCTIRGIIGRGGMGIVYDAEEEGGRRVALKVLNPAMLGDTIALLRFKREAGISEKLHHPHVVEVYGSGEADSLLYYKMERVDGDSLSGILETRDRAGADLPDGAACRGWAARFSKLAGALDQAHQADVIHRDVKPGNILVEKDGKLRLVDFGIARAVEMDTLTATSAILGTPLYMAPEQAVGKSQEIGPAVDVYALGATLYEVVTGRSLFDATEGYAAMLTHILHTPPRSPCRWNAGVPRGLETVVLRCLEKRPEARYASAALLAEDLERVAKGLKVRARRVGPLRRLGRRVRQRPALAATVLGLLVTVGILMGVLLTDRPSSYAETASAPWIDIRREAWLQLFASSDSPVLQKVDEKLEAWKPTSRDEEDEGLLLRSWIAYKRLDHERALNILDPPENLISRKAAHLLRAAILRTDWQYDRARAEVDQAKSLEACTRLDHFLHALHLSQHEGEQERAVKLARDLVDACPAYLPARILLVEAYRARKDYKSALTACGTLLLMRPTDPTILMLRGQIHRRAGKRKEAEKDFRAVLDIDARNSEARIALYYLLCGKGAPGRKAARTLLAEGLKITPQSHWLLNARGWQRKRARKFEAALADFESALRSDPFFHYAQINLGETLLALGRETEAIAVWQSMLEDENQPQQNACGILNSRAIHWWNKGKRESAFRDIRRALDRCYRPMAHNTLIYFLIQEERYGEALKGLDHLLSLVPVNKEALARRGKYRMFTYDLEGARSDCDRAIELYGKRAPHWVRSYRAQLAILMEDPERAEQRIEEAGKGKKSTQESLSWLLIKADFLLSRSGREAEVEACFREFRSRWKPDLKGEDERPWMDQSEVRFHGLRDGWKSAVETWKKSTLPEKDLAFLGGRFAKLRMWVQGAQADKVSGYRKLCRAILERKIEKVSALLGTLPHPEGEEAAWVVGSALLKAGRVKEALPLLGRAARVMGLGACDLDLGLARARLGRWGEAAGDLERALLDGLSYISLVRRLHEAGIPSDPVIRAPFLKPLSRPR